MMDMQEKIEVLSILLESEDGITESEELLTAYLNIAKEKILNYAYPYNSEQQEVPEKYENLQIEIAQYLINKRGAEGQTGHSENGINRSYESADVPLSMLKVITPYVGGLGL